jgi:hypothetical protein
VEDDSVIDRGDVGQRPDLGTDCRDGGDAGGFIGTLAERIKIKGKGRIKTGFPPARE